MEAYINTLLLNVTCLAKLGLQLLRLWCSTNHLADGQKSSFCTMVVTRKGLSSRLVTSNVQLFKVMSKLVEETEVRYQGNGVNAERACCIAGELSNLHGKWSPAMSKAIQFPI